MDGLGVRPARRTYRAQVQLTARFSERRFEQERRPETSLPLQIAEVIADTGAGLLAVAGATKLRDPVPAMQALQRLRVRVGPAVGRTA